MKKNKISFFKKVKNSITNFDSYINFAEEKTWTAIKYLLKLMLIFTIIVTTASCMKAIEETKEVVQIFKAECPEFKIQDNILVMEGDNKKFVTGDKSGYIGIVMNSEKENVKDIEEGDNYQILIAVLKDKITIRNNQDLESSITYSQINTEYNVNEISKEKIINILSENNMMQMYSLIYVVFMIYLYENYLIKVLVDILLLSVIGYLFSRIIGIKFKYKSIFNMSLYALTLSIILFLAYVTTNVFIEYEIKYFDIAYNAIAYIYIITAMLTMKADFIKQQIEVGRIIEEQKKIKEEKEQQERDTEKEQNKEDKEEQQEKENKKETPEGNQA